MTKQYYELSDFHELARKLLREGQTLAVWLTDKHEQTALSLIKLDGLGGIIDGNLEENLQDAGYYHDFRAYCKFYQARFILPTADPTISLQQSLTMMLNECDELRSENAKLRDESSRNNMYAECFAKSSQDNLSDVLRLSYLVKELQAENEQLKTELDKFGKPVDGISHIKTLEKALYDTGCELRTLHVDRANLKRLNNELREKLNAVGGIETLEGNLNRSESDRLYQLITSIMRMIQALEETPLQKHGGAIYLIKRVLYEAICELDPSQAIGL